MKQEWLLLDMHLHSEYSKINKPSESKRVKSMTPKEYVEILLDKKVKVFSITDHNYFSKSYYDEIEKYIKENNINMKLINGVELDVYVKLSDQTEDFIHVCMYFDDNVDRNMLESTINNLYKDDKGNEKRPYFNEILESLYDLKTKIIIIPHGDKERGMFKNGLIDHLNIRDVPEFYKYAMYKIFNAFDVRLNFLDKSNEFWASSFCENTKRFNKLIEGKSPEKINEIKDHITLKIKNKEYVLSEEENAIYDYILKYGSYFAYFIFSDWHNAEEYNPQINNFIFGSMDTAFESFEMATLDPVSRIITSKDTEIQIPTTILSKVNFSINEHKKQVLLSPGLNAIVGKRGSGKSLLLSVIRNLVDKEDPEGALIKYKKLKIDNISGKNRGGIDISPGGLSSVAFLTQDEIKEIFENPEKAQKTISSYFINIKDIDMSKIHDIIDVGSKIIPINKNYKNLTSNILALKKFNDYNYNIFKELNDTNIRVNFNNLIKELKITITNIKRLNLNADKVERELNNLYELQQYYLKIVGLYNKIIETSNEKINSINSKRTNNQITQRQNMTDIKNIMDEINNNFEIQLNFEKLKVLLDNFSIENPPIEIFKKGKYLFVTYYEIPENIKDILIEKLTDSISRGNSIQDIKEYMLNTNNKKLKVSATSLVSELQKYINSNNVFQAKKEFYEIKNSSIDYKSILKTMKDLNEQVKQNNLVNLTEASPGMKSVAYLDMLFDLDETILILDQPEDNIDNDYISNYLVPNIKDKKKIKQLIFVTHNPSVAVYGDAFNYVFAENNEEITYKNFIIEKKEDKEKLIKILEGGRASFSNRNKKFGNVLGEEEYENS